MVVSHVSLKAECDQKPQQTSAWFIGASRIAAHWQYCVRVFTASDWAELITGEYCPALHTAAVIPLPITDYQNTAIESIVLSARQQRATDVSSLIVIGRDTLYCTFACG